MANQIDELDHSALWQARSLGLGRALSSPVIGDVRMAGTFLMFCSLAPFPLR
jgi:hypothetical protein